MFVRRAVIAVVMIVLTLVAGCGKTEPTATPVPPTNEPVPPTATSVPPTAMAVLPTGTPVLSTATPVPLLDTPSPTSTPVPPIATSPTPPASLEGTGELRITIVYDNTAYDPNLKASWGFAALVEYGDHTVLFDTGGDSPTLLGNMTKLGLDPQAIEAVVLSHEHGDHIGGLQGLLDTGIRPTVYVPAAFSASFKDGVRTRTDLVEVADNADYSAVGQHPTEPLEIFPGIYSTGELGATIVEQALMVETQEGIVVITGCAHPGVVKMVRQAQEVADDMSVEGEVALVMGGFHLVEASESQIERIIADFRQLDVERVSPTHCTGEKAIAMFAAEYGNDYVQAGAGVVIAVGPVPTTMLTAPSTAPPPTATATSPPVPTATSQPAAPLADPFTLISQESLFAFMEDLTAIQPYSGWRNSATEGEAEALDYVTTKLGEFVYLGDLGLGLERQSFRVFNSTELWETRLHLTVDGQEAVEVPADGVRGYRDDNDLALRFDSDGELNDAERDPVVVDGAVVLIETSGEIHRLTPKDVAGKVILLNYAAIDRIVLDSREQAVTMAEKVLALQPAGIVLITRFSNELGASHGAFVGDGNGFVQVKVSHDAPVVPILYARLEDLAPLGIADWADIAQIESARLTWDADVFAPGVSGNLVARIPGADSSQAVILSAHIDSPNSPGALDDGSGSVVLLEVARVLNAARVQPAVDLYLVWFGSEELGVYGSAHFCGTHQELLDRTLAMLQIDCLTRPLDGIRNTGLALVTWSYGRLGDDRLMWPDYLAQVTDRRGIPTYPINYYAVESDNTAFGGFDVPNANMIYTSRQMERYGSIHYAAHLHSPYDTVELVRDVADVLEQMAHVALAAALQTAQDAPNLRVVPKPDRRAVFVASHTEAMIMSPIGFTEFGMALGMEGFDVDMIPYGQAVTPADLEGADLVVALPLLDYTGGRTDVLYNEAWSEKEIAVLEDYVNQGGFLILTNSAHRLKFHNWVYDDNEDWREVNALAERFGVSYRFGAVSERLFWVEKIPHPLLERVSYLELMPENAVPLKISDGRVLARNGWRTVIGLVDHGDAGGQVLALADIGMLGNVGRGTPENITFWQNIARYARSR